MKDYLKPVDYTDLTSINVGDKVQIKSKAWYDKYKDKTGNVNVPYIFTETMSESCDKICTVKSMMYDNFSNSYTILLEEVYFNWSVQMLKKVKNFDIESFELE